MNLDQYRETLRRRMRLCRILWLAYLLLIASTRLASPAVTEHPAYAGLLGFVAGGLLVAVLAMSKFHHALKDDTVLRRLYNKEHDERAQAIRARAGVPVTLFMGCGLMAAGLVATLFDMTVALTLVVAGLAELLVTLALKVWYSHRM